MHKKEKTAKLSQVSPEKVSWGDLLGYEKDKALLKELVREGRLPTVMLFKGRPGIGKSAFLFFLAALHFCESQDACGQCPPCQRVASNQEPDLLLVKGGGDSLKVSSVSDISDFIGYSPQSTAPFARRLVLIVDAEDLTTAAVNKLLKTLEEPSSSARIFISSSRVRQLLPTLLSRCVHWRLRTPSLEEVESIVKRRIPQFREILSEDELRETITRFGNSPSQVLALLSQSFQAKFVKDLVRCRKVGEILSYAENFRQQDDVKLSQFIPEFEYALNSIYTEVFFEKSRCFIAIYYIFLKTL